MAVAGVMLLTLTVCPANGSELCTLKEYARYYDQSLHKLCYENVKLLNPALKREFSGSDYAEFDCLYINGDGLDSPQETRLTREELGIDSKGGK